MKRLLRVHAARTPSSCLWLVSPRYIVSYVPYDTAIALHTRLRLWRPRPSHAT